MTMFSYSQPGGGGGVTFKHFYDSTGKEIDIENSEKYKLECYLLNDTLFSGKNIYSKLKNNFRSYQVDSMGFVADHRDTTKMIPARFLPLYKYKAIKLEPINSIEYSHSAPFDNFRIMLSTQNDTMVIDFIKIIGENAHSIESVIDSISYKPGYFQYKKRKIYPVSYPEDTFWDLDSLGLSVFSTLITSEERFLGEFQLVRINEEIKEIDQRIKTLKESAEWKKYDKKNKEYVLGELNKQKKTAIWYRKKLLSEKKTFISSKGQD